MVCDLIYTFYIKNDQLTVGVNSLSYYNICQRSYANSMALYMTEQLTHATRTSA
jgi:hypothetical protein